MRTMFPAAAAALFALIVSSHAGAVVRADYQFQNTLTSSVAGAPALTNIGAGSAFVTETVDGIPGTVLAFPLGNGLSLAPTTTVTANNTYTIVALVRLADVAGYRKYFDFKNGTSDNGLYAQSGTLYFYPTAQSTTTPILAGAYAQIALTRDVAGNMVGYVDGVQVIAFTDAAGEGIIDANNALRFFIDDEVTGAEESAGAVARLRIFDNALTPAEVAALDRLVAVQLAQSVPVPASSSSLLLALVLLVLVLALPALRRS